MIHFKQFLSLVLLLSLLQSCQTDSSFCSSWHYDPVTNDLSLPEGKGCQVKYNTIRLGFDDYITFDSVPHYTQHSCNLNNLHRKEDAEKWIAELQLKLDQVKIQTFLDAEDSIKITELEQAIVYAKEELVSQEEEDKKRPVIRDVSFIADLSNELLRNFKINGTPFHGRLEGYHKKTGKKILEFDIQEQSSIPGFSREKTSSDFSTRPCTTWTKEGKQDIEVLFHYEPSPMRKPIVYLYPDKEMEVNVQLNLSNNGYLTTTYPKYSDTKGWTVKAKPDGTLFDTESGKEYYALYWEGKNNYLYQLSEGFSVKSDETAQFLEEKLSTLGLTRREANEFINFWLPILEESPYNFIHFATDEYVRENEMLVTPKPQTSIRVMMVYYPSKTPINTTTQTLKPVTRKGFTVVEWGGMLQRPVNG